MAIININGVDTPVEIVGHSSDVSYTGDKTGFRIEYGNGLVKVGGVVNVPAAPVKNGVIEGTHNIEVPFLTLFDYGAVAMNVADTPENITGESVFVTDTDTGFKIYATASATSAKTIPVRWYAEGVV